MWKIYASKTNPFWSIQNGNKPSKIIFDEFCKNFEAGIDLHLNFIDNLNAQFVGPKNSYKYFKLENEDGDVRYYFVNSIDKAQDSSYVYNVSLDIYATYTLNFIEQNKDVNFFFNRTHNYDRWVGIVGDRELDEAPKALASVGAQKYFYPSVVDKDGNIFWYNNYFGISNVDTNCYKYFVFKDGPNGSYTCFPIINKTKAAKWYEKNYEKGKQIFKSYFRKGDSKYFEDNRVFENNITPEINNAVREAYKNGDFVEYFYMPIYDKIGHTELGKWEKINTVWGTMPIDFNGSVSIQNDSPATYATTTILSVMGRQFYYKWCDGQVAWEWKKTWENVKRQMSFLIRIFERVEGSKKEPITIENSEQSLYEMLSNPEWSNKFVGIFAGPNILAFDDGIFKIENITGKNRVKFNLPPDGIEFTGFNIYRYVYREVDGINNIYYGNEYSLKYLNVNYFNNNILANHRKNSQNTILFSGKLLFCNGFSLISKNSDLIPLSQSLISYGGMLPTSKNEYLSMVNAQRNSMDTSYAIKRQEANISSTQGISNGVIDAVTSGAKAAASAAAGDIGGAANSAIGGIKSLAGGIYNVFNNERQLKNYRKMELSKFKDANNTLGNNISFSSLADASIAAYMDSETGEQFEAVEAIILNSNTNIFINNYLYLYGFYYPHLNKFSRILKHDRKFNYIELGETSFENNINAKFNFLNPAELELVKEQLKNGIRIWNQNDLTLPDDFEQKLPQIGGDFENSPVPPPNNLMPGVSLPSYKPGPGSYIDIKKLCDFKILRRIFFHFTDAKNFYLELTDDNNTIVTQNFTDFNEIINISLKGFSSNVIEVIMRNSAFDPVTLPIKINFEWDPIDFDVGTFPGYLIFNWNQNINDWRLRVFIDENVVAPFIDNFSDWDSVIYISTRYAPSIINNWNECEYPIYANKNINDWVINVINCDVVNFTDYAYEKPQPYNLTINYAREKPVFEGIYKPLKLTYNKFDVFDIKKEVKHEKRKKYKK